MSIELIFRSRLVQSLLKNNFGSQLADSRKRHGSLVLRAHLARVTITSLDNLFKAIIYINTYIVYNVSFLLHLF